MRLTAVTLLAILMIAIPSAVGAQSDSGTQGPAIVVGVDAHVVSQAPADTAAAESATRLATAIPEASSVAFFSYGFDRNPEPPAAFEGDEVALARALDEFSATLSAPTSSVRSAHLRGFSTAFSYLSDMDAPEGSRFVLVAGDGSKALQPSLRERLLDFAALFAQQGWHFDVVMLPSALPESREFLKELSQKGQGNGYDFGVRSGMSQLIADRFGVELTPTVDTVISDGSTALSPIVVPPFTDEFTLVAIRMQTKTQIEFFDPNGAWALAERPNLDIVQSPNVVIVHVTEPEAGRWTVRALGEESLVFAGVDIRNRLSVALLDQPPVPVGRPAVLRAAAVLDGERVPVPGGGIDATIHGPDGSAAVYSLNDTGTGADQTAGDGIFSVTIPPRDAQAIYDVTLALGAENFGSVIRGRGTFQAEEFPALRVEPLQVDPVDAGDLTEIAEIQVRVGEFPFPVEPAIVEAEVVGPDGLPIRADVEPKSSLEDGRAWQFGVNVAPDASGRHEVSATLQTTYLGRDFTASAPPIHMGLDVILPPPPGSIPPEPAGIARVPVWVWVLIGLGVLGTGTLTVLLRQGASKPEPYGFLYDDRGRVVVDFRRVRQNRFQRLFARNRIPGISLPGIPIENGEFVFSREAVELRAKNERANVRVNGEPAGRLTRLSEGARIGIGGRLLTFARGPLTQSLSPGAAD